MSGKKKLIVIALLCLILASTAAGLFWFSRNYILFDFTIYAKDTRVLDLRQETLSSGDYENLQKKLPGCYIIWRVPFQSGYVDSDVEALTVDSLTEADVQQLRYFPNLLELHGEACPDLTAILQAGDTYPNLELFYQIPIGGAMYPQDTHTLQLDNITQADVDLLYALPELKTVSLSYAGDIETARALEQYCRERSIGFGIRIGKDVYDTGVQQLTIRNLTQEQLTMLQMLPQLQKLHLEDPEVPFQAIQDFRSSRSAVTVTWEKSIWGKVYSHDAEHVDLSDAVVGTLEEVEQGMTYLPNAKQVFLGFCQLDNEEIAAYRERSRDRYKVVWVVDLSGKMQVRTDIDNFMPSRDGWGYVRDHEIDNIRYCEEIICMDIGHMGVKDVSFLETLVNLEYLILAHTEVQYVDAIVNCKKLKYLELDWSCIRDVSPLVELTALEDLNLGMTWPDLTPLRQMTWLKNLYLIQGNSKGLWYEWLPNTRVVTHGDYTVSMGWRKLPNYYKMRDILGMYYM